MDEQGKYLSKSAILMARDIIEEDVEVPEWGGAVRIRSFKVKQQREVRERARQADGTVDEDLAQVHMFIEGVIEPRFDAADAGALQEKSAMPFMRVVARLLEISGVSAEAARLAQRSFPEGSAQEVPVPAGAGARDDGGGAG